MEAQQDLNARTLWAAVLVESVRVAVNDRLNNRNEWSGHRGFLSGGGRFKWICCNLDLDPEYVLRKIKEVLENPQAKEFYLLRMEGV